MHLEAHAFENYFGSRGNGNLLEKSIDSSCIQGWWDESIVLHWQKPEGANVKLASLRKINEGALVNGQKCRTNCMMDRIVRWMLTL